MKNRPAAINYIWFFLIVASVIVAAYTGKMDTVTKASFDSAKSAVTLALSLIGAMALWLGIMKVAESAGLTVMIARAIRPVMVRLFPEVPAEHPAMSAIIMNMAANMLGLGNAATPLGIKAMTELDKLNPEKGTATNAMCLFLAINTSSVTILPLGVIAVRAAAGAASPASILFPSIFATCCSTAAAVFAIKFFAGKETTRQAVRESLHENRNKPDETVPADGNLHPIGPVPKIVLLASVIAFLGAIPYRIMRGATFQLSLDLITRATQWIVPVLMATFLFFGYVRGIKIYEKVSEGAKEGFQVAVRIIPFMVAIFVAIGMFRASGALDLVSNALSPVLKLFGMPADVLPMAFLRPLSGTGAFGVMSEIVSKAPDGFSSFLASVMQGSTETTFYVLAVYFGAVGIQRTRYALNAALIADAVGIIASVAVCNLTFNLFG